MSTNKKIPQHILDYIDINTKLLTPLIKGDYQVLRNSLGTMEAISMKDQNLISIYITYFFNYNKKVWSDLKALNYIVTTLQTFILINSPLVLQFIP